MSSDSFFHNNEKSNSNIPNKNEILENIKTELFKIGEGVFSNVYSYNRNYAIKILKNNHNLIDSIPELIISNKSKSQFILSNENFFMGYGKLIILLKKADCNLYQYINSYISVNDKNKIIYQICSGLNYLHDLLFLHLDISLSNILILNGNALISDFSHSCKTVNLEIETVENKMSVFYRPYENLKLIKKNSFNLYTYKSDLWSLGIVIYEILNSKKFEDEIKKIYVNGEYNPEFSILFHIEKLIAWNVWPFNSLLNINEDNRFYENLIEKRKVRSFINLEQTIKNEIDQLLSKLDSEMYKSEKNENLYRNCEIIIRSLYSKQINFFHIFNNNFDLILKMVKIYSRN